MITEFLRENPKISSVLLIAGIGFISFSFSGLSFDDDYSLQGCEGEMRGDFFEGSCTELRGNPSRIDVGDEIVYYSDYNDGSLNEQYSSTGDLAEEALLFLIEKEGVDTSKVGVGSDCEDTVDEAWVCSESSQVNSELETVFDKYGLDPDVSSGSDGSMDLEKAYQFGGSSKFDSIVSNVDDRGTCSVTADLTKEDPDRVTEKVEMDGDVGVYDGGASCVVEIPEPYNYYHRDLHSVEWSYDFSVEEETEDDSSSNEEKDESGSDEDTSDETGDEEQESDKEDSSDRDSEDDKKSEQDSVNIFEALIDFLVFWK